MAIKKINNHTWVVASTQVEIEKFTEKLDQTSITKCEQYRKNFRKTGRTARINNRKNEFQHFVKDVFEERKFICQKEFYELIKKHIGFDATYYKRRMLKLKMIHERNLVITPITEEI